MPRYILRMSGEYSTVIEAPTLEEAKRQGEAKPEVEWDCVFSEIEGEELESAEPGHIYGEHP